MGLLTEILNTVAYGLIILGLLFAAVDAVERKSEGKKSSKEKGSWSDLHLLLNYQTAIFLGIAGFVLLIIGVWVH